MLSGTKKLISLYSIGSYLFQKLLLRLSERLIKAVADRQTGHARLAAPGFCARMS